MDDKQSAINDLLDRWEDARERGVRLSPEELCVSQPQLLNEVRNKIAALQTMESRLQMEQHTTHIHTSGRSSIAIRDREQILTEQPQVQTGYEHLRFHAQGGLGMVFEGTDL